MEPLEKCDKCGRDLDGRYGPTVHVSLGDDVTPLGATSSHGYYCTRRCAISDMRDLRLGFERRAV